MTQNANAVVSFPGPNAPRQADKVVVVTGGTAVVVITGPIRGGYIVNPGSDAGQGVTSEPLFVDLTKAPGSTDGVANGTTSELLPSQNFNIPALLAGQKCWVNAATSGHKFTAVVW